MQQPITPWHALVRAIFGPRRRVDIYTHQERMAALVADRPELRTLQDRINETLERPVLNGLAEQAKRNMDEAARLGVVRPTPTPASPAVDGLMGPWTQVALWKHRAEEAEAKLARAEATVARISALASLGHVAFSELTGALGWKGHTHMTRDIKAPGECPRCDNPAA